MPINQFYIISVYIFIKFRVVSKIFFVTIIPCRLGSDLAENRKMICYINCQDSCSLRKPPFLLALRRWGRFVPGGEERGETDVFAG